jgi:hypothetical protein
MHQRIEALQAKAQAVVFGRKKTRLIAGFI